MSRIDEPWPGGESWRQAVARVSSFLDEVRGGRVLLIGHVATRWALDHRVHGRPLEELAAEEFDWQPGWEYELIDNYACRGIGYRGMEGDALRGHLELLLLAALAGSEQHGYALIEWLRDAKRRRARSR